MGKSCKQHVFKNIDIKGNLQITMPNPRMQRFIAVFVKDSPYDKISKVFCGYDHLGAIVKINASEKIVLENTTNGWWSEETNHSEIIFGATTFDFAVYFPQYRFGSVLLPSRAIYGDHEYNFEITEAVLYESDEEKEEEAKNGKEEDQE
jgi:hypothetical protein